MSKLSRIGILIGVLVLFSGCAFTPQQTEVQPNLVVAKSNEGNRTKINLRVIDERANQIVGRRGSGAMKGAEITTVQPLDVVFHDSITTALQNKGFEVVSDPAGAHDLKIEIRAFEYDTSTGFWSGGLHTNAAIKAIAKRGSQEYENLYRYEDEKRVQFVPGADKNAQLINQMATGVLTEMFSDSSLFTFLAQ